MLDVISKFLEQYNLPWLLLAVISWVILYFSCSWRTFLHLLPVGIWTMVMGSILEHFFISHKFWIERFILLKLGELDLFVSIGPFFSLGVLLIRFLPQGKWRKLLAVLFWSAFSTLMEIMAILLRFLAYHGEKWGIFHSFIIYFFSLMSTLGFYYTFYTKTK
ncbi:hypothetical protein [Thermotalea metallivorans]|uniref:Uncharacterized protein n=1 Tax=Thermotalea metallivorans TaxID=520762 RepID=A0A140L2X1_9FIRM|nr:hypothetical protein [Thermotalea metallivorans]KXG74896.1 hypothetical protein AN619_20660 [Thermotalea metallivorans]